MAKPPRSPLLGYNHNVKYGGQVFHVQTEDSGPGNPHLFTHLFFEGSILASKRSQYDPIASEEDVRAMMQAQHKAILKELKQKTYDDRITTFFEMRGQTFSSQESVGPGVTAEATAAAPPEAPPVEAVAPVAEPAVLDLDALPNVPGEKGPTPEPLPIHLAKPAVPGPGTYTFRRPTRDQFPTETPTSPAPPSPRAPAGGRPSSPRPVTPVVVQRQVVVGSGAPPASTSRKVPTTPVRRRPVSGGPYVVKEGSHANIPGTVQRAETRPLNSSAEPSKAPRTAEPKRTPQEGAPASFVTDQSLDDVILAYLSQGEGKR
jgi:hypothetical protein